jgi:ribosomal subunit interface protein
MEIKISARNLTVSSRFSEHVADRAPKVKQLAHEAKEFSVKVTRHDHTRGAGPEDQVELTVFAGGSAIRTEAHASDKFVAFDVALAKLLERLRRESDKRKIHHGRHGAPGTSELASGDFASLDIEPIDAAVLESLLKEQPKN